MLTKVMLGISTISLTIEIDYKIKLSAPENWHRVYNMTTYIVLKKKEKKKKHFHNSASNQ